MPDFYDEHGRWQEVPGLDWLSLGEDDRIAYEMGKAAARAVEDARKLFQEELDYGIQSVATLERVLTEVHRKFPRGPMAWLTGKTIPERKLHELTIHWGAYLGEVMRINHGFQWIRKHPIPAAGNGHYMRGDKLTIAPVDMVWNRLTNVPREGVVRFYESVLVRGDQTSLLIVRDEDLDN